MKDKLVYALIALLSLALAAYCGYVFCTASSIGGVKVYVLAVCYLLFFFLSVFVADFLHEIAHVAVGKIFRMGVHMPKIKLLSPSSVTLHPVGDKHLAVRMAVTTAAGLTVNLACLAVGVAALFAPQMPSELCVLAPYSFYMFALNALPVCYESGKTDGLIVWEILSDDPSAKVMLGVLRVQALVNAGTPLAQIDERLLLDLPQLPEDDINFIILTKLRCDYYLARGNNVKAQIYYARYCDLKEYLPKGYEE